MKFHVLDKILFIAIKYSQERTDIILVQFWFHSFVLCWRKPTLSIQFCILRTKEVLLETKHNPVQVSLFVGLWNAPNTHSQWFRAEFINRLSVKPDRKDMDSLFKVCIFSFSMKFFTLFFNSKIHLAHFLSPITWHRCSQSGKYSSLSLDGFLTELVRKRKKFMTMKSWPLLLGNYL